MSTATGTTASSVTVYRHSRFVALGGREICCASLRCELDCYGRKQGVSEQVDILLRQATGCDNLANMYEGWTPWV